MGLVWMSESRCLETAYEPKRLELVARQLFDLEYFTMLVNRRSVRGKIVAVVLDILKTLVVEEGLLASDQLLQLLEHILVPGVPRIKKDTAVWIVPKLVDSGGE